MVEKINLEKLEGLRGSFNYILIYGNGEVARWFWEIYGSYISEKFRVLCFKTNPLPNEFFYNNKVEKYGVLKEYDTPDSIVLVATHEKIQNSIIEIIKSVYQGRIIVFDEEFINEIQKLRIKKRKEKGFLSVHFADIPNMGDQLNRIIIKELYDFDVVHETPNYCNLAGIGSGLGDFFSEEKPLCFPKYEAYIWGMGFIDDIDISDRFCIRDNLNFLCVRGFKSKEKLEKYYEKRIDCAVGDPGLLVKYLNIKVEKKYCIGIIPHFKEIDRVRISDLQKNYNNSIVIDLRNDIKSVLSRICECEIILSSSLHGAMVADAFGIPNMLVKFSDIPMGDGFKYGDYYSVYGIDYSCYDMRVEAMPTIEKIKRDYIIKMDDVNRIACDIQASLQSTLIEV